MSDSAVLDGTAGMTPSEIADWLQEQRDPDDRPAAADPEDWALVLPKERPEAIERAGFMRLRGLDTKEALRVAVSTMEEEIETMTGNGRLAPWWVVRAVASAFPLPRRVASGHYVRWIIQMAEVVEENARAAVGHGSAYAEEDVPMDRIGPYGRMHIDRAIENRRREIAADPASVTDDPSFLDRAVRSDDGVPTGGWVRVPLRTEKVHRVGTEIVHGGWID